MIVRGIILVFAVDTERAPDGFDGCRARSFVQGNAHLRGADLAQVDAFVHGRFQNGGLQRANLDGDRVKKRRGTHVKACAFDSLGQARGFAVNPLGNCLQAFRAMKHRIKTCHHGQQRLRRANIRCRLFAADMLFAGLQ